MRTCDVAELKVATHFAKLGYDIFVPIVGSPSCDLVVSRGCELLRVEVKSTSQTRHGKYVVGLKRVRNRRCVPFDKSESDKLAIYIIPLDKIIVFDTVKIMNRATLVLEPVQL